MGRLGRMLREAREGMGLSHQQIQEASGIEESYSMALEGDEYGRFLNEAEAMSYLRVYSRHLGLNPRNSVSIYRSEVGYEWPETARLERILEFASASQMPLPLDGEDDGRIEASPEADAGPSTLRPLAVGVALSLALGTAAFLAVNLLWP